MIFVIYQFRRINLIFSDMTFITSMFCLSDRSLLKAEISIPPIKVIQRKSMYHLITTSYYFLTSFFYR